MKINEEWKQENGLYKCPYCNELKTRMGICSHIIRKHINYNITISRLNNSRKYIKNNSIKDKICISKENIVKYINKEQLDLYINQGWSKGNLKIRGNTPPNKGKKLSERQCQKISKYMKEVAKRRSYQSKVGRGKNGWYKGFWCDSSWELAYVIYCLDHNINISRNNKGFQYIFENEEHTYYPDFYNNDMKYYIEIKGFENNRDKEKIKQFKENIKVYYYKDMKPILEYVKSKYGKDFIELYES